MGRTPHAVRTRDPPRFVTCPMTSTPRVSSSARKCEDGEQLPSYDDDSPRIFQILCDSARPSAAVLFIPAKPRAVSNTPRNIAGVNRPVNVFCWLGDTTRSRTARGYRTTPPPRARICQPPPAASHPPPARASAPTRRTRSAQRHHPPHPRQQPQRLVQEPPAVPDLRRRRLVPRRAVRRRRDCAPDQFQPVLRSRLVG